MKSLTDRLSIFQPKIHGSENDKTQATSKSSRKQSTLGGGSDVESGKRSRIFSQHQLGNRKQSMFVSFAGLDKRPSGFGHRAKRKSSVVENIHNMYHRISDVIETEIHKKEREEELNRWKVVTTHIKLFLSTSLIGAIYDWTLLMASVASICLYIAQLYYPHPEKTGLDLLTQGDSLFILELCLCMIFTFDIVLWTFLAENKFDYLTSVPVVMDLCFILPTWITLDAHTLNDVSSGSLGSSQNQFIWLCFLLKTTRILRGLRLRKKFIDMLDDEVQQRISGMGVFIVIMILFSKFLSVRFLFVCLKVLFY